MAIVSLLYVELIKTPTFSMFNTELFSVLYADDTTGLNSDSDLQTLLTRVGVELNKLANWFRSNRMALNVSKTKYMIFHVPEKNTGQPSANL